jgi:hypothetical protein
MRALQLTEFAKVRMWPGGAVPGFAPLGSVSKDVEADPSASLPATRLTLEAYVPRGGLAQYGLIGVIFQPAGHVLRVEVPYCAPHGARWPGALARGIADDVRLGLPAEYADPVLEAAAGCGVRRFPAGSITIVEAAHGLVGSSASFFMGLISCVLEVMCGGCSSEDEHLCTFLTQRLVKQYSTATSRI